MSYDYFSEFLDAADRTGRLGLQPLTPELAVGTHLTPESLKSIHAMFREVAGEDATLEQIAENNFQLHLDMITPLEQLLGCRAYYTIGSVETPKGTLYPMTEEEVRGWLAGGAPGPAVNAHTWITLDSLEVLDLTLLASVAATSGDLSLVNSHVAGNPEELAAMPNDDPQGTSRLPAGLRYHPFVVGEDLFRQMGLLADYQVHAGSLYDTILASDGFPLFVIGITRTTLRAELWAHHRELLDRLLRDRETARRWRDRIEIRISGYENDPRELFEIPEARAFMTYLAERWPYAFYFLNKEHGTFLRALFYACCAKSAVRDARVPAGKLGLMIDPDKWDEFNRAQLQGLAELRRRFRLPADEIDGCVKHVASYFNIEYVPRTPNLRDIAGAAARSLLGLVGLGRRERPPRDQNQ